MSAPHYVPQTCLSSVCLNVPLSDPHLQGVSLPCSILRDLGFLKAILTSKDIHGEDIFRITSHQVICPIQQWFHFFLSLPFPAELPGETLLVALHITFQSQIQVGFWFSNHIPAHLESVSVFLTP